MSGGLLKKYHDFLGRFTYRQRFVYFGIIFFLFIPPPLYFVLQATNLFYKSKQVENIGIQYQNQAGSLLNAILQLEILKGPDLVQSELYSFKQSTLENRAKAELKTLSRLDAIVAQQYPKGIGKGFSKGMPVDFGIGQWESAWEQILQHPSPTTWEAFEESYGSLSAHMRNQIVQNGRELNLYGNSDPEIYTLLQPAIDELIPSQVLIGEISVLDSFLQHEKQSEKKLKVALLSRIMALKVYSKDAKDQMLKAFNEYSHIYYREYQLFEQLRSSCIEYYNTLENFLEKIELIKDVGSEDLGLLAIQVLTANEHLRKSILNAVKDRLDAQQRYYKQIYWFNIFFFAFVSLLILIFLILRVITRHLVNLINHASQLAQGNFGKCFCSGDNDEFGTVGKSFDVMSDSVEKVATDLRDLSRKLADASVKIAEVTSEQEKIVCDREEGIKNLESTAQKITNATRDLANTMQEINIHSVQESLADKAKDSLESLKGKISELGMASESIVGLLGSVEEKMNGLSGLIVFMTKVSENANLLSLNAAIETANVIKHKESFAAISQKIQRFAHQTELSTEDIKKILQVTNSNVTAVKSYAVSCLKEISAGAEQLINFSVQLTRITRQGKEQLDQFKNITSMMQDQAGAEEMIMQSITDLRQTAEDNTKMIQNLNQSLSELSVTANDLRNVLHLFGKDNKNEL